MASHQVFLVPGFFGFANFGDIKYFAHVREILAQAFAELGEAVEVHYVKTVPTASLPKRAAAIGSAIAATGSTGRDPVHLIGHSTGGLDARLFTSPGVSLPSELPIEDLAGRVRSIVAIASPHYGTPLASLFTSLAGQRFLRVLSVLTLHGIRLGSMPLPALVALAGILPRVGRLEGPVLSILDQVYRQLLKDFDQGRRTEIEEFFGAAKGDQSLLPQLAPEGLEVFNAAVTARPTTRHGCVVTQARPPSIQSTIEVGLSPSGQAIYSLYRALYQLASLLPDSAVPVLSDRNHQKLMEVFGEIPSAECNDAIVPTRSQIWGEIIHATWADHLDVIGHFNAPTHEPPHIDWLATQSRFTRASFETLWRDIARFMTNTAI